MSTMVVDIETVRDVPFAGDRVCRIESPPGAGVTSAPLRLTRRGQVVLVLAVLAIAYGLLTLLSTPAASTGQVRHVPGHRVVVEPGQTLWDIARSVAPQADPREVVAEIVDLNSLPDPGAIRVGQPLNIPEQ
jgi:LysM repeat protein